MRFFNAEKKAERGTTRFAQARKAVKTAARKTGRGVKKVATAVTKPFRKLRDKTPPRVRKSLRWVGIALAYVLDTAFRLFIITVAVGFSLAAFGGAVFSTLEIIAGISFMILASYIIFQTIYSLTEQCTKFWNWNTKVRNKVRSFFGKVFRIVGAVFTVVASLASLVVVSFGFAQLLMFLSSIDPTKVLLPVLFVALLMVAIGAYARKEFKAGLREYTTEDVMNEIMDDDMDDDDKLVVQMTTEDGYTKPKGRPTPKQPKQGHKDNHWKFSVNLEALYDNTEAEVHDHILVLMSTNELSTLELRKKWAYRLYNLALKDQGVTDPSLRTKASKVFYSEVLQMVV